jgi:hypothetical protein
MNTLLMQLEFLASEGKRKERDGGEEREIWTYFKHTPEYKWEQIREAKEELEEQNDDKKVEFFVGSVDKKTYALITIIMKLRVKTRLYAAEKNEEGDFDFKTQAGYAISAYREEDDFGELENVDVDEDYRGKHLCKAMVAANLKRFMELYKEKAKGFYIFISSKYPVQAENCYVRAAEETGLTVSHITPSEEMLDKTMEEWIKIKEDRGDEGLEDVFDTYTFQERIDFKW